MMQSGAVITKKSERKRGFLLSVFLLLGLAMNALISLVYFFPPQQLINAQPSIGPSILTFMGVIPIVQFFAVIGIWCWKRIALFCIYGTALCSTFINIYIDLPAKDIFLGLIGVGILYLLTKNKMEYFE